MKTLAPADQIKGIESSTSSSPAQGPGLHLQTNHIGHETLFQGRVDDVYPPSGACLVSLYRHKNNFPCIPLSASASGLFGFGAINVNHPVVGTEVLVYVPSGGKYGYIVGYLPTVEDTTGGKVAHVISPESGVTTFSEKECWFPPDWGVADPLPVAGGGLPLDVLPGDSATINENGVALAVLRVMSTLKAGELAKIEAYVLDDLLRIVGHNMETFTAMGETKVSSDYGRVTEEEVFSDVQHECMGMPKPNDDTSTDDDEASARTSPESSSVVSNTERPTGRWRWKRFRGFLGELVQTFICRPSRKPGTLDDPDSNEDAGLYHEYISSAGQHIRRNLVGGGLLKTYQVAVPKKRYNPEDPEGDKEVEEPKREDFKFSQENPMGLSCQIRDFLAWTFNCIAPERTKKLEKDWHVPDESDCPAPGAKPEVPGNDGFFRKFPREEDVMQGFGDYEDESGLRGKKFRVGEAWILIMQDGSISLKDAWGSTIDMRGGHINLSASHDINLAAGGSIVAMAGDDLILKARQSMDLTSSENQVRIKAEKDVMVHSETGGMLLSTSGPGGKSLDSKGEEQHLSGIVLKSKEAPVTLAGKAVQMHSGSYVFISGVDPGQKPNIFIDGASEMHSLDGTFTTRTGSGYSIAYNGEYWSSGSIRTDESVQARGSVIAGGSVGGGADFSNVTTAESVLKGSFEGSPWDGKGIYYTSEDFGKLKFTYRSSKEYYTTGGRWFEAAWQRDLADILDKWDEKEIDGRYPYPGEEKYSGDAFYIYEEGNVTQEGKPKRKEDQKAEGGKFSGKSFKEFPVLPKR